MWPHRRDAGLFVAGPAFFGVGFQTGLTISVLLYLILGPTHAQGVQSAFRSSWFVGIDLLAGVLSHVAADTVGIGVAATQLQFWLFTGLFVVAATRRCTTKNRPTTEIQPAADARPVFLPALLAGLVLGGTAHNFLRQKPIASFAANRTEVTYVLPDVDSVWTALLYGIGGVTGSGRHAGYILVYVGLLFLPWI